MYAVLSWAAGFLSLLDLRFEIDYEECRPLGYENPVRTSPETHYFFGTEPSRLMLCKIFGFHGGDYEECRLLGYENPVRTSPETHYFFGTEPSRLMLCKIFGFHGGDYEECRLLRYENRVRTSHQPDESNSKIHCHNILKSALMFSKCTLSLKIPNGMFALSFGLAPPISSLIHFPLTFVFLLQSRKYPRRMPSSEILRPVAIVRTDVSEDPSASIIKVTRIFELGTKLAIFLRNVRRLLVTANVPLIPSELTLCRSQHGAQVVIYT
jgi:hypothetical protein